MKIPIISLHLIIKVVGSYKVVENSQMRLFELYTLSNVVKAMYVQVLRTQLALSTPLSSPTASKLAYIHASQGQNEA